MVRYPQFASKRKRPSVFENPNTEGRFLSSWMISNAKTQHVSRERGASADRKNQLQTHAGQHR